MENFAEDTQELATYQYFYVLFSVILHLYYFEAS